MDVDSAGIVCQASVAQDAAYPRAKRIHDSWITQEAVQTLAGRIVLHLRPPCCPRENKSERLWLDLHANVTRNHTCAPMVNLIRRISITRIAATTRPHAHSYGPQHATRGNCTTRTG